MYGMAIRGQMSCDLGAGEHALGAQALPERLEVRSIPDPLHAGGRERLARAGG
jgi:hypothetical protein